MDIKTVQGRSKHEGLSFLTITLPSFGKDFHKALDQGVVARDMFKEFRLLRHGGIPVFLQGFLGLVFDRNNGVLLDYPDIDAIIAVRQLTLIFSKIHLECSDARVMAAMHDYVQCDSEVKVADARLESSDKDDFSRVSALLFSSLFSKVDKKIYDGDHIPKHGPGATVDGLRGNSKYRLRDWTTRLESGGFHSGDFLFPSASYFVEHYDELHFREPGSEMPVKVIPVPKTQKTPRIIAKEPTCMQYAQQSVREQLYDGVEDCYLSHFIGFESQEPNQLLAREGSRNRTLATLDLSEASDRVSNQLVRLMLRRHPPLHEAVEACRSRRADVPGEGIIRLAKFASMVRLSVFLSRPWYFLPWSLSGLREP
jgi:hypothetical protein